MTGSAGVGSNVIDLVGPWHSLAPDADRTPIISFGPPIEAGREIQSRSTDMHADYFRIRPARYGFPNVQDYFRYAVMDVFRSASSATPLDNAFLSLIFPTLSGGIASGARLSYVTVMQVGSDPEFASLALSEDAPVLQLVFSARAFVLVSLPALKPYEPSTATPTKRNQQVTWRLTEAPPYTDPILALPAPKRELPHVLAVQRLRDALPVTDDELADIFRVGRTTPYKWNREGASPQPKTLRLVLRLDAIVRGLLASRDRVQFDEWLIVGSPSPLQLLRDGAIDSFERRAYSAIFRPPAARTAGYDIEAPPLPARSVAIPAVAPRRAKVSLTKRDR